MAWVALPFSKTRLLDFVPAPTTWKNLDIHQIPGSYYLCMDLLKTLKGYDHSLPLLLWQTNQCRVSQFYICVDLLYHADLQYNIMQWTDEEKGAKPSALTRGWGKPGRMQHLQLHTLQIFLCRHWFLHVCTHCTIHTAAFSCASGWWRWRPLCTYVV